MHPKITSSQNLKIKSLLALEKPRERKNRQQFLIEGKREIMWAVEAGYTIESIFFCEEIISLSEISDPLKKDLIPVSKEVFEKIAVREDSGGLMAVAKQKTHLLSQIELRKNPLVLILEAVEKPGNLGAILRTADAAAVDAVIICDPQTDFYNPNVIRSSVGCVFTNPLAAVSSDEAIAWLKKNQIKIFCTSLQASKPYHQMDFTQPTAIVMGTEATGLSEIWTKNSDANIIIPMQGKIGSRNVSNAAAVVVIEVLRQRGK